MPEISIVGGESPLGREVRDRLKEASFGSRINLLGSGEDESLVVGEEEDEPSVVVPPDAGRLRGSDLVITAGTAQTAQSAWKAAGGDAAPPFIDLTYGLEGVPDSRLRCPLTEPPGFQPEPTGVSIIAHPAASVLAAMLLRIQEAYPLRTAVANVFEPASERGNAGLKELQQQVMSLLSFRPMEKRIFDAQIGFNLLGRYGEDAPEKLQEVELRIERHLATLLGGAGMLPSLRLIQAPVFHGHTFSLWLEFDERPDMEDLEAALESPSIEVRGSSVEPPSNVGAAGQSGVSVGLMEPDRNHPRAVWLWAASDNYRVMADNAAAVAQGMLARNPGGERP